MKLEILKMTPLLMVSFFHDGKQSFISLHGLYAGYSDVAAPTL